MEDENITKAAIFKKFLHFVIKTQTIFFVTVLFNIITRKTLTDNSWGLHKNMNCAFPLRFVFDLILFQNAFYLDFY